MPAPPPPPAPAPHAALRRAPGEVAGRRERGSGSAALPRGRRQCWPAAPGNEVRPGARHRRRVSREGGRLPVTVATQRVFIPSCLRPPALPSSAAPDRTPRRSPGALPGASAAAGRSRRCPGEERTGCPRSAPRRPGLPPLRPAPAPRLAAAAPAGAPPPGRALPCAARQPSPPAAPRRPRGGTEPGEAPVPGPQPKTRLPVKIASKLPARGDGTAGCSQDAEK